MKTKKFMQPCMQICEIHLTSPIYREWINSKRESPKKYNQLHKLIQLKNLIYFNW